jgi:hypothetical protein
MTPANQIAVRAHAAVKRPPVSTPDELVERMLAKISAEWDDLQADVIRECNTIAREK